MSSWEKLLGLLYSEPTQTVWDSNKNIAIALSTYLVREQVSRAIDAQGMVFLANTNRDPDLVRKQILWYLIMSGWDKERIDLLNGLKSKVDPRLLFHVEPPRQY